MKLTDLCHAGRSPELPVTLRLPAGELQVDRWLRVLPGKRYVGQGSWNGRRVLAKLLVGPGAGRQYRREHAGAAWLVAQGLATPALVAAEYCRGDGGWLLFDYLDEAESLGSRWHAVAGQPPLSAAQEAILGVALEAIGRLHARGLWQEDLHLDNLLWHRDQLFWIDGGGIRLQQPGRPLAERPVLANLATFFAQLPATLDPYLELLLPNYRRGNVAAAIEPASLFRQLASARQRRLADYLGKTRRNCTLFSVASGPDGFTAVRRDDADLLHPVLADPERFVATGQVIKSGNSSTVVRIRVAERTLVIKRYNIKGYTHWLRRFWRPTRAWHSWREGHRLVFLGIPTPRPVAVVERRSFWLRGRAYLITESVAGQHVKARFKGNPDGLPPSEELSALQKLFLSLVTARISHGDLKASNLLWNDDHWTLIDLDAARQHRTRLTFTRAYARDRQRFLDNWPADSALFRLLDELLPRLTGPLSSTRG